MSAPQPELSFLTSGFLPWIDLGFFRIQSYFVVISLVLCAMAFVIIRRASSLELSSRKAMDLYIAGMIGGFLGARLFHIFWEEPRYYAEDPLRFFDFIQGGFVWYGGLIGASIAVYGILFFSRTSSIDRREWLDLFAPVAAFGYGLGRLACVLTGCCYGDICHLFPGDTHELVFRLPSQGFAVVYELGLAAVLLRAEAYRWPNRRKPGELFFLWVLLHGIGRLLMELMRADPRGPMVAGVSIASLVSLILILLSLYQLRSVKWSGFLPKFSKLK